MKLGSDRTFYACYPHPRYPTLSVTGVECSLQCKHCGRHYLKHMIPCSTPEQFLRICKKLYSTGARGLLLSGGYNAEGYVPFEPFLDVIEQVKKETELFVSTHTGLTPSWLARELGRAGVDLANFDLVGDNETIRFVLGVDRTIEDYRRSLRALKRSIPHVVPHICLGLHAGKMKGERRALEIAAEVGSSGLVFLILMPTKGTDFEHVEGPTPESVGELIAEARLKFPKTTLALGCMRPRDGRRVKFELQALHSGIDRIEMPSEETVEAARKLGLQIKKIDMCCSVPSSWVGD
ncbi:MAG: radical SAM protein [Hadesarchaea archaeon]|nr:MAG: radical SAM protein [Hadesarchaea archaeon]